MTTPHIQSNEEIVEEFYALISKYVTFGFLEDGEESKVSPLYFDSPLEVKQFEDIFKTFIRKSLTTKDQQIATAVEKERERIRPFVERVRLDVEVIKCDCGEPYKESDLDISVAELEAALPLPTKDSI